MSRNKIRLDTMTDIQKFVEVVTRIPYDVVLEDNDGYRVSAKSLLGAIYTMEWDNVYCFCEEKDITSYIFPWVI